MEHYSVTDFSPKRVTWGHLGSSGLPRFLPQPTICYHLLPSASPERRPPETFSEVRSSWGAKYSLRKAVNPVNRPTESAKNGHNTGFLRMARPRQQPRGGCVW